MCYVLRILNPWMRGSHLTPRLKKVRETLPYLRFYFGLVTYDCKFLLTSIC